MRRDKPQEIRSFSVTLFRAAILSGIAVLITGLMLPAFADESITISCYSDAKSPWSVGSVTVFNIADAAQACNSLYYDCRGRCIGCYQDFDYVDNVCVDMLGNTFLK